MKTETAQEQLKRIGKELEEIGFERVRCDTSAKGQQRWDELWARGQELSKQYNKLKEKIDAGLRVTVTTCTRSAAVRPTD